MPCRGCSENRGKGSIVANNDTRDEKNPGKIPNLKHQITNKSQMTSSNSAKGQLFRHWILELNCPKDSLRRDLNIEHWNLSPRWLYTWITFLFLLTPVRTHASGPALSLQRIFSNTYMAGTRPTGPKISPGGSCILFRWDSSAHDKY